MITLASFTVLPAPNTASVNQELVSMERRTTSPLPATSASPVRDESSKGKAPTQDVEISMQELNSFSLKHKNLGLSVSDPVYTRRLIALMNARKDRRLSEGIGNNLILSTGLVFQQLEGV